MIYYGYEEKAPGREVTMAQPQITPETPAELDSDVTPITAQHYVLTVSCTSLAVRIFSYSTRTQRLYVTYASGAVYRYDGVPVSLIGELMTVVFTQRSVGSFVNQRIRSVFPYTRMS